MTEKNQTRHINSYNVKGAEHSVTLTIHSLTNNPFNATEETTFDLTFTFVNSIDEQGVTA